MRKLAMVCLIGWLVFGFSIVVLAEEKREIEMNQNGEIRFANKQETFRPTGIYASSEVMQYPGVCGEIIKNLKKEIPINLETKYKMTGMFHFMPTREYSRVVFYDGGNSTIAVRNERGKIYGEEEVTFLLIVWLGAVIGMGMAYCGWGKIASRPFLLIFSIFGASCLSLFFFVSNPLNTVIHNLPFLFFLASFIVSLFLFCFFEFDERRKKRGNTITIILFFVFMLLGLITTYL